MLPTRRFLDILNDWVAENNFKKRVSAISLGHQLWFQNVLMSIHSEFYSVAPESCCSDEGSLGSYEGTAWRTECLTHLGVWRWAVPGSACFGPSMSSRTRIFPFCCYPQFIGFYPGCWTFKITGKTIVPGIISSSTRGRRISLQTHLLSGY